MKKTPRRTAAPSAGSSALAAVAREQRRSELARGLHISPALVHALCAGTRRPSLALMARIAELHPSVPVELWDAPLPGAPAVPGGTASKPSTPSMAQRASEAPGVALGSTVEELEANVRRLKRIAEAAAADPSCPHRDRSSASASLTLALRARARAKGEEELTAARVIASRHFRDVFDLVVKALVPFPEAFAAAHEAVRKHVEASGKGAA